MRPAHSLALLLLAVACGDDPADPIDASPGGDAGSDAAVDAGVDTGANGSADADMDTGLDAALPDPVDPFEGIGAVELVAESHEGVAFRFLEGPHWRPDETLVFSDLAFGDPSNATIYALTPPSTIAIVRRPSLGANGNATDPSGELVTCLQADRRVVRGTSTATTVFDAYLGMRLNAPNDLVFRRDGTWYFTDPGYGVDAADLELPFRGVFRVTPGGELVAEYTDAASERPNGVALSPDETTLYVADTEQQVVRAFDVAADGSLSGERAFVPSIEGPDGLAVDESGNVYVASVAGVRVFARDGREWGTIEVPRQPSNCGFGDRDLRTLYITARQGLYRVRLPVAGS